MKLTDEQIRDIELHYLTVGGNRLNDLLDTIRGQQKENEQLQMWAAEALETLAQFKYDYEQGANMSSNYLDACNLGSNSALNLDICFDGRCWRENCHPWWRVKYFDSKGNLVREFGD